MSQRDRRAFDDDERGDHAERGVRREAITDFVRKASEYVSCTLIGAIVLANFALLCLYEAKREKDQRHWTQAWISGVVGVILLLVAAGLAVVELRTEWDAWPW